MKKWIIFLIVVVLVIVGSLVKVYLTAMSPVKSAESKAVSLAKEKTQLDGVDHFHIYNGNETVDIIEGKDKNGQKIIVWIPEKSKKVIVKKAKDGLTKQQAVQKLLEETKPQKIISVRLGMEKGIPLWEIYYQSENNLINYYYVDFQSGQWLKKIENL